MKRMISTLMATILLALSFAVPVFAQESSDNSALIDSLLEERAALICLEKWNEVDSLDQQLESLGVEKLTAAEVDERFGSINGATPYVSTPASTNVTWLSSRTNYTYNGVTYEIQTLTAQPNQNNSNVGYQYPTFTYSGGSVKPNVIQGNRTITSTPSGYNSNVNAVKAYSDPYAARRSYVGSVKITGLESKSVSSIYPVCPEFPAHIY